MKWQSLRSQGGPFVYRVTLEPFPLAATARQEWAEVLRRLLTASALNQLEWEVFAQCNALHIDSAKNSLSARGRDWMPEMVLGMFPDGVPPSLYTPEEIMALAPGEWPRPMSHQMLRISKNGSARMEAVATFAGSGSLAAYLPTAGNGLAEFSEVLRATIEDSTFGSFPSNVPIFGCSTALNVGKVPLLDQALNHVSAAVWEDYLHGEACVMLASPLETLLPEIKAKA